MAIPLLNSQNLRSKITDNGGLDEHSGNPGYVRAREEKIKELNFNDLDQDIINFRYNTSHEDPLHLSFYVIIDDGINSPLFNGKAENFLKNRNLNLQLDLLQRFKEMLLYITATKPWYFLSISGLDNIEKLSNFSKNDEKFPSNKYNLSLNIWDDVVMNFQTIINYYKRSVFDFNGMRWNLPKNLRTFSIKIRLGDCRHVGDFISYQNNRGVKLGANEINLSRQIENNGPQPLPPITISGINSGKTIKQKPNTDITYDVFKHKSPYKEYTLYNCEFNFDNDTLLSGEISNEEPLIKRSQFSIDFYKFDIKWKSADGNVFSDRDLKDNTGKDTTLDDLPDSDNQYTGKYKQEEISFTPRDNLDQSNGKQSWLEKFSETAIDFGKRELTEAAGRLERNVVRSVNSEIAGANREINQALDNARRQVDRNLNSTLNFLESLTKSSSGNNVIQTANNTTTTQNINNAAEAKSIKDRISALEKELGGVNVYEAAYQDSQNVNTSNLGNVYDR